MIFEDKDRIVFAGDSVTDADKTQPHGDDDALPQKGPKYLLGKSFIILQLRIQSHGYTSRFSFSIPYLRPR